jgi:hypothetical protein
MPTTNNHLKEEQKARVAAAAQAGARADFVAVAEDRYARLVASGRTIAWEEMKAHLEQCLASKAARKRVR